MIIFHYIERERRQEIKRGDRGYRGRVENDDQIPGKQTFKTKQRVHFLQSAASFFNHGLQGNPLFMER